MLILNIRYWHFKVAQKLGRDIDDKFTHIFKNVTQVVIRSRMQNVKFTVCLDLPCELARLFPDRPRHKTSPDKESHGAGHLLLPTTHGMQKFILKVNKNKIFCSQNVGAALLSFIYHCRFRPCTTSTNIPRTCGVFTSGSSFYPTTWCQRSDSNKTKWSIDATVDGN